MDKRIEIIKMLKIGIGYEIETVLNLSKDQAETLQIELHAIVQSYLLLQMLDTLERMDKTLNLIATYTSKGDKT